MSASVKPTDLLFGCNEYDSDGDPTDTGIFLHSRTARLKVAENLQDFLQVIARMQEMYREIAENYDPVTLRPK